MKPLTRDQSLDAVPVAVPVLARHPLAHGGARIVISVEARPWQRKLLRMPPRLQKEFELDAFGDEIFGWCNGSHRVADLLELFAEKHPMDRHESDKAVLAFLRTLVSRGLVILTIIHPASS